MSENHTVCSTSWLWVLEKLCSLKIKLLIIISANFRFKLSLYLILDQVDLLIVKHYVYIHMLWFRIEMWKKKKKKCLVFCSAVIAHSAIIRAENIHRATLFQLIDCKLTYKASLSVNLSSPTYTISIIITVHHHYKMQFRNYCAIWISFSK